MWIDQLRKRAGQLAGRLNNETPSNVVPVTSIVPSKQFTWAIISLIIMIGVVMAMFWAVTLEQMDLAGVTRDLRVMLAVLYNIRMIVFILGGMAFIGIVALVFAATGGSISAGIGAGHLDFGSGQTLPPPTPPQQPVATVTVTAPSGSGSSVQTPPPGPTIDTPASPTNPGE